MGLVPPGNSVARAGYLRGPVARHNSVRPVIIDLSVATEQRPAPMFGIIWAIVRTFVTALRSRRDLLLENLALRQQLAACKARGKRPRIGPADRAFWVLLRRPWARWAHTLVIVKPDTVVRWHRAGFRLYWRWICSSCSP